MGQTYHGRLLSLWIIKGVCTVILATVFHYVLDVLFQAFTWPSITKDERYSKKYLHLEPLSAWLTGNLSHKCDYEWPRSTKVDVIVVDVGIAPYQCTFHCISDAELLQALANTKPANEITTRLYFVEDMTPIVVEILGSALGCSPELFLSHMHHYGYSPRRYGRGQFLGDPHSQSMSKRKEFFSLPFRRPMEYWPDPSIRHAYEKQRTMFRDYNDEQLTQEDRISGAWYQDQTRGIPIGILLFDSGIQSANPTPQFFEETPRYSPTRLESSPQPQPDKTSLRDVLINRFKTSSTFVQKISRDPGAVFCTVLSIIRNEWVALVSQDEILTRQEQITSIFGLGMGEDSMMRDLKFIEYLQENLEMLKNCLGIIRHPEKLLSSGLERSQAEFEAENGKQMFYDMELDFQELIKQVNVHIKRVANRSTITVSILMMEESRKGILQAENIGALTSLATFYIPLSFVSSLLGMNVSQLSSQNPTSIWVYFAIAVPLSTISFVVVGKWKSMMRGLEYLFRTAPMRFSSSRRQRWLQLPDITWRRGVVPVWRQLARNLHADTALKSPWKSLARNKKSRENQRDVPITA